ncbi:hypothetical protein NKH77_20950 [Streptomyces sp. M19]
MTRLSGWATTRGWTSRRRSAAPSRSSWPRPDATARAAATARAESEHRPRRAAADQKAPPGAPGWGTHRSGTHIDPGHAPVQGTHWPDPHRPGAVRHTHPGAGRRA